MQYFFFLERFFRLSIVFFAVFLCLPAFSLQNAPEEWAIDDDATGVLIQRYSRLCDAYQTKNVTNLFSVVKDFHKAIFNPISSAVPFNHRDFLEKARKIDEFLQEEFQKPTWDLGPTILGRKTLHALQRRICAALLDINIQEGKGLCGDLRKTTTDLLPGNLPQALISLVGKIYQIKLVNGRVDVKESVLQTFASGMLVHWDKGQKQFQPIQSGQSLNGILTCAHAFGAQESESYAYYFMRAKDLDPETGFPPSIRAEDVVKTLETSAIAYKISGFHARGADKTWFLDNPLSVTQPHYGPSEDWLIGIFDTGGKSPLTYAENCQVAFNVPDFSTSAPSSYFAAGYSLREHYESSATIRKPTSLFVASSHEKPQWVTNGGTVIAHSVPCMSGMSGGPLFEKISPQAINVLGVLTRTGSDGTGVACHWH